MALCGLVAGCATFDYDESDSSKEEQTTETTPVTPTGWGSGTQTAPYTPENLFYLSGAESVWMMGYVVGSSPQQIANAEFGTDSPSKANILISSNPDCCDIDDCVPVELSSTRMQKALSLYYHPEYYQQCVVVCGTPGIFHSMEGLRRTTAGYCLPDFNLADLTPTTSTSKPGWDYQEFEY